MNMMKPADANPQTPKINSTASNAMVTGQEQHCPDRKMRSGQHGTYRRETLIEGVGDAPRLIEVVGYWNP